MQKGFNFLYVLKKTSKLYLVTLYKGSNWKKWNREVKAKGEGESIQTAAIKQKGKPKRKQQVKKEN